MKDYRVEIRVKNNLLYTAIKKDYPSVSEFCKQHHLCAAHVGDYINMKIDHIYVKGTTELLPVIQKLCTVLNKSVVELFPEQYYLPNNKIAIEANKTELVSIESSTAAYQIAAPNDSIDNVAREEINTGIDKALCTLSPREETILRMYFGLGGTPDHSFSNIGLCFGITGTRVSQIFDRAIRKLKHPSRSRALKPLLYNYDNKTLKEDK